MAQTVKNLPAKEETQVPSLSREDPLEKGMAIHSSSLAWGIPWKEEPGGLYSPQDHKESDTTEQLTLSLSQLFTMQLSDFTFTFHFQALGKEMATHSSVLAWNPRHGEAWWAAIYGVAQSWTQLKRFSSSHMAQNTFNGLCP